MRRSDAALLTAVALVVAFLAPAGAVAGSPFPQGVETMAVDELRPGMTGYGYTVLRGTEPERFEVEILGVLRNPMPKQDLVVARLSGAGIEEIGVAAGMSGSPVYIDDRLVGAISYRLGSFPREPIAGITPISLMLGLADEAAATADGGAGQGAVSASLRGGELLTAATGLVEGRPAETLGSLAPTAAAGGIAPIATPVAVGGTHPEVLARLQPLFAALGWHATVGGTSSRAEVNGPLRPGSAVAVHLMRGDITFTASGTVTHVEGDRVYAFGHPFMQGGSVEFPMSGAEVLLMRSDLSYPEKITAAGTEILGAVREDRQPGIYGSVGEAPAMIPVAIDVNGPEGPLERFDFEMVPDETLSPTFLFLGLANALQSIGKTFGDSTFEVEAEFEFAPLDGNGETLGPLQVRNLFSSPSMAFVPLSQMVMSVYAFVYANEFEPVEMRSIRVEITGGDDRKTAEISRVWADRLEVRAGEEVDLSVWLEPYREAEVVKHIRFRVPDGTPPGPLTVLVGDAGAIAAEEQTFIEGDFAPRSLADLLRLLGQIRVNDSIYVQASRPDEGAFFAGDPMPSLPVSMLQILSSARTSGEAMRLDRSVLLEEDEQVPYVVSGSHRLELTVRR